MLTYESSIADLKSKTLNILAELKSQNLTIEQIVTLKVLNVLKSSFFIYLTVLMKSARKKNKFSNLIELFQNLTDEENRQRAESVINLIRKGAENESKRENKKNENKKNESNEENESNDKKNKCFRCDRSPHSKEKCSIVNSECTKCHKIDH
jgi:alpha-ketoglutarate-dependent taurine dioxygenase